jgi:flagellar protein FlaG
MAKTFKVIETKDYRENYANSVQLQTTLWDFSLFFGIINHTNDTEALEVRTYQAVYISPQQAKALTNLLVANLQKYEATFGEICMIPKIEEDQSLIQ